MTKERLQKIAGLLKEVEDFDLSDNPFPSFPFNTLGRGDVLVIDVDASRGFWYDGSDMQQGSAQQVAQRIYDEAIAYWRESAKEDADKDEDENEENVFNYYTEFVEINTIDEGCYIVNLAEESFRVVIDSKTRNKAARELVNYLEGDEGDTVDPAGVDDELFGNLINDISDGINEAEDFDLSDNPLQVNPNSWKTFKKACKKELAHLMPLTSECSLIEPGNYGADDKLIGSFLNGYEMLDFYIEACQEWYDGDFQEMLDSWGSYADIEETAEDLAKATVYVSGIDDDIILAIVEDVYYMVNYDEESLNETEDFDLSDNPLVGEPATELAYAKFGDMDWVDLKNNNHGELSFASKYNKYIFKTWHEWVEWLADDATSLQYQNLRAFDITPFLPIQNSQFETAKAFFNMYQKKYNGAPFILMYKK